MNWLDKILIRFGDATPTTLILPADVPRGKHRFRAPEMKWVEYNVCIEHNKVVVTRASFLDFIFQIGSSYLFFGKLPGIPSADGSTISIAGMVRLPLSVVFIFSIWLAQVILLILFALCAILAGVFSSPTPAATGDDVQYYLLIGIGCIMFLLSSLAFKLWKYFCRTEQSNLLNFCSVKEKVLWKKPIQ